MRMIVKQFWQELSTGFPKKSADTNLQRVCKLQKNRLDEEGLKLETEVTPFGALSEVSAVGSWKDEHYKTTLESQSVVYNRVFYKKDESKPIKKYSGKYFLYTDVTECPDYTVSGKENYVCPNCGAMSTLRQLQVEGCSYCGTKFVMSELYPKVSGFYAIKDLSETSEEAKKHILKFVLPILLVFEAINLFRIAGSFDGESLFYSLFSGLVLMGGTALLSFALGYVLWAFTKLGQVFFEAGKGVPKLTALGSSKKFTGEMKKYSGEFSYEFFTDKVISILKTVIYSSKDENLPNYLGEETGRFDHVVESSFTGALALKSFNIKNEIITVHLDAFIENFYSMNGHISRKEEKIPLTVQKDLSCSMNYHFNIRAVKCLSCGGSFDALSNRLCPYCKTSPDMKKQDWVIIRIG